MKCEEIVIIPTIANELRDREVIRKILTGICVFFFSGIEHRNINRKSFDYCNTSLKIHNVNTEQNKDYVLLPIIDHYFNLGTKLYHMLKWTYELKPRRLLYMDMDMAKKLTRKKLVQIFEATKHKENFIMGDILNCLTPANQFCCCDENLYQSLNYFYNVISPYQKLPPMMWGGGGTVVDDFALRNMMRINPRIHYSSDHTISFWAYSANVRFYAASWTNMRSKWCPILNNIPRINATSWKCKKTSTHEYTFSNIVCK